MKKYITLVLIILLAAGSSCKKDFLSLEANPNVPSVASPDLLLAGALKNAATYPNSTMYTMYAGWMGYLSWSTGFQVNTALEQYIITTSTYDNFTNYYLNISNFSALAKTSGVSPNYIGIAKIMMVYDYMALVDNYGNVPYSQAIQGTGNLAPAYDSGQSIYDDLLKQLDAAITTIQGASASSVVPGAGDIVFAGNMANWLRFANTLKVKMMLRMVNIPAKLTAYQTAVNATASLGYLGGAATTTLTVGTGSSAITTTGTATAATANPGYTNSDANGGQQSPLWLAYGTLASGAASGNNATYQANAQAAHYYGVNNDPRLTAVYSATSTANVTAYTGILNASIDTYNGVSVVSSPFGSATPPNGIPPGGTRTNLNPSKYGPGVLKSPTMNANVLSAAEAQFLLAEASARGLISGTAATYYNAGITASFVDDNLTAAQAATYYAQTQIAYPTGGSLDAQIKAIIFQKWAAFNLYGAFEAYNDFRRTGYPDNIATSIYTGANAFTGGATNVVRIPYPAIEYQTNAGNVSTQAAVNPLDAGSKIFWAK